MPADRWLRRAWGRFGRERSVTEYLPQFSHVRPHIIRNIDGSVHAMFEAAGARWEDLDGDALAGQHEALCSLHRTLNLRLRLTVTKHLVHAEAHPGDYPALRARIPFVAEMDAAYRFRLVDQGHLWTNTLLLGFTIRPPTLTGRAKRAAARTPQPVDQADLDALEHVISTVRANLGATHGLRLLGLRSEGQAAFSEIAEAHSLILTGRFKKVPLSRGRLAVSICAHRPVMRGDKVVELRQAGRTDLAALFGLSTYPAETAAGMFNVLLAAPYRLVFSQSFGEMRLHESQAIVSRTTNQFVSANDPAFKQKDALALAANDLQERLYGFGVHNLTLMVLAEGEQSLAVAAAAADDDLRASGAIVARLDWDLEAAYFGQVPGTEGLHPRSAPWTTRNFAAAAPLHNFPRGWRGGRWCDFAALLTTNGGTPYYWNPHTSEDGRPGDVPHLFITGPNGSGKTTVLLALLGWLMERAGAQVVLWDKDRGAKLFVMRMGGAYIEIRVGEDTGLAPLKALDGRNPGDMAYLSALVRSLILADEGPALLPEDEHRIDLALRTVMGLPPALRSFNEVRAFLGAGSGSTGARLRRWCAGRELGWVLDNPRDRIRLDAQIIGFDQTRYMDHREACGPIQSYLFHRVGKMVDGRRMIVAIDEFWKSLTNAAFRGLIQNGLATFRKQNCGMWLVTQSVGSALMASDIAHTIREQCLTQMHFPNGGATWADFGPKGLGFPHGVPVEGAGTNPEEVPGQAFRLVKSGLSGGGRGRFLLKQGTSYVPVQLCLEGMDDIIATLSARTETVDLMDAIAAEMPGADMDALFAEFHRRRRTPAFEASLRGAWQPLEDVA